LSHPHIAGICGLEDSTTTKALVLEFVDGPTLANLIAQGRIPGDEALAIARQTADALEAAHEAGVIHRDLKPANIKLRPDGAVKVLDFGPAKLATGLPRAAAQGFTRVRLTRLRVRTRMRDCHRTEHVWRSMYGRT
jgi:serine/threonine-protein kinase